MNATDGDDVDVAMRQEPATRPLHGTDKVAESDDPMSLEAVSLPLGDLEVMSRAFVEEYARLGLSEDEIYLLFLRRIYFGTHLYFDKHGEAATRRLIRDVLSHTGVYRYKEIEG